MDRIDAFSGNGRIFSLLHLVVVEEIAGGTRRFALGQNYLIRLTNYFFDSLDCKELHGSYVPGEETPGRFYYQQHRTLGQLVTVSHNIIHHWNLIAFKPQLYSSGKCHESEFWYIHESRLSFEVERTGSVQSLLLSPTPSLLLDLKIQSIHRLESQGKS